MRLFTNRLLNLALWLTFTPLAGTGLLLHLRLPPGSRGGHGLAVAGLSRHEWGDLHTLLAYTSLTLIAAHLLLHGAWLVKVAARSHPWRLAAGLTTGIALLATPLLLPQTHHTQRPHRNQPTHNTQP